MDRPQIIVGAKRYAISYLPGYCALVTYTCVRISKSSAHWEVTATDSEGHTKPYRLRVVPEGELFVTGLGAYQVPGDPSAKDVLSQQVAVTELSAKKAAEVLADSLNNHRELLKLVDFLSDKHST
jgi:hypothetical protein